MGAAFGRGDILLPREGLEEWSVVACDQFTSDPGYWDRAEALAGDRPSSLRIVFPEARLETADFDGTVASIHAAMAAYLREGVFRELPRSMVYVERTLLDGSVRRGLVGCLDLARYDYRAGSGSLIRATEGTVADRLPPRVRIREGAPLESPHILILIDDPERRVVEPQGKRTASLAPLYDFQLMLGGGRLRGWLLDEAGCARVEEELLRLERPEAFREKYGLGPEYPVLAYAVGDGNHSLAAARECFLRLREAVGEEAAMAHPARDALVELGNLHDPSLRFEPVHRAVFGAEAEGFLSALRDWCAAAHGDRPAQRFRVLIGGREEEFSIPRPERSLAVGSVQDFLDEWAPRLGWRLDYIHGEAEARRLAEAGAVSVLLPAMEKSLLFPAVIREGALPRKTFSMGEAQEKRYYLECRRLTPADRPRR